METFLLLLFPITKAFLGNFLSGMETFFVPNGGAALLFLGNFLSGMETHLYYIGDFGHWDPWKLP